MREVFFAVAMLSLPVAVAVVLGGTALHLVGAGEGRVIAALPAEAKAGHDTYLARCADCHGPRAEGTDRGPSLLHPAYRAEAMGDAAYRAAVRRGVRARLWGYGDMPAIPGVPGEELDAVIAFLRAVQAASPAGG